MRTIPQKALRNQVGEVLRQAEAGEEFVITVSGRPVARLGPAARTRWVPSPQVRALWELPPDDRLRDQLPDFDQAPRDPWNASTAA